MSSPKDSARALASDLRAMADALVRIDADDPALTEIAGMVSGARLALDAVPPSTDGRRWVDASVFVGALNPVAPPLTVTSDAPESGLPGLRATASLGVRYEGPSGHVHGGIVAGMLDELLGATVSQLTPGRPGVTGRLNLRYKRPTPLHVPLELRAWVTEDRGRVVNAVATCSVDGMVAVEAKAMFVRLKDITQ